MSTSDWKVEVRDVNRNRVGQLDDFKQLEMVLKYNDLSTWRLTVDRRCNLAADLLADGAGILVYRGNLMVLSGYWTDQDHQHSLDTNTVIVSGEDDTGWLKRRKAYPDPNDITPPFSAAQDVRTGQASGVIRQFIDENGGLACPVARRIPGLFADSAVDPLIGGTVTGTGKWQKLLPLCQDLATQSEAAGTPIAFRIIQSGTDLLLVLYAPADKSDMVVFSLERGNLAGFQYKRTAPTMTFATIGDDGTGTGRVFYDKANGPLQATWGRIEDDLVDSRNGTTAAELSQAADQALATGAGTTSLSVTPIDLPTQQYGVDYQLGDKVTVLLDSVGPQDDTVVADAIGQGPSVTPDYLIAFDATGLQFPEGTRVVVQDSSGNQKDPGVRVVVNRASAFGYTNIYYFPDASANTALGDHLLAVEPPAVVGAPIQDLIREVAITLSPDSERITPAVGNTGTKINPTGIFKTLRAHARRIVNLEVR